MEIEKHLLVSCVLYLATDQKIFHVSLLGISKILYFSEPYSGTVLFVKAHQAFHDEHAVSLIDSYLYSWA